MNLLEIPPLSSHHELYNMYKNHHSYKVKPTKYMFLSFLFLTLSAKANVKSNNLISSHLTHNFLSTKNTNNIPNRYSNYTLQGFSSFGRKKDRKKTWFLPPAGAGTGLRGSNTINVAKKNYYIKAANYFKQRKRPLRHFLDFGIGGVLIESFYPFKTTSHPFFAYMSYRKEKWGQTKIPIIFSLQYESLFNQKSHSRIQALAGLRYPTSHDLTLFHVDFMLGTSVPVLFKIEETALELRLLFTHIIGPKAATKRLYFQWGTKARLKDRFQYGLVVQAGLDMHL